MFRRETWLEIFDTLMMWHTFSQPLGIMTVAVSLCGGGVFERFPKLRAALLEGNCAWAPWLMHRLDEHYEWVGWAEAPDLTRKPSEYFRSNWYATFWFEENQGDVQGLLDKVGEDEVGEDRVLFETDFPHPTCLYPSPLETIAAKMNTLRAETRRKVMGDNAARLYRV